MASGPAMDEEGLPLKWATEVRSRGVSSGSGRWLGVEVSVDTPPSASGQGRTEVPIAKVPVTAERGDGHRRLSTPINRSRWPASRSSRQ